MPHGDGLRNRRSVIWIMLGNRNAGELEETSLGPSSSANEAPRPMGMAVGTGELGGPMSHLSRVEDLASSALS